MSFSIGPHTLKSPYVLAPMAGVSEMPFRTLAFDHGAGLATTELISAKGLFHQNLRTQQYLRYDPIKERPYSLQLFGGEADVMADAAAQAAKYGAEIIDINMGCPVKKVTKTGAGSALLCEPKRAGKLIETMRRAVGDAVPITAKIRSGWDAYSINCVDMAKTLEDAGCAAVAIHPRTRAQGYSGQADWSHIKAIKDAVQIPVIGNGDVNTVADALRMRQETGCDGVMIGRAALGNPWIFSALNSGTEQRHLLPQERLGLILTHLASHMDFHQGLEEDKIRGELRAIRSFRNHLVWYSRGIPKAGAFRELVMQTDEMSALLEVIRCFFSASSGTDSGDTLYSEHEGIDYRQAFG